MKKFNEYVKTMVEKCEVTKDDLQDDFHLGSIGDFLALSVEKYYKNERLLSFFKTIQSGVNEGAITNRHTCQRGRFKESRLEVIHYCLTIDFHTCQRVAFIECPKTYTRH